jgi:hypothetical protein
MTETQAELTSKPEHDEDHNIIVNAESFTIEDELVSFEQIVHLAYPTPPSPDTRFTVTFRNAKEPKEGSLAAGHSVEVKTKGTIFNVKSTGKS